MSGSTCPKCGSQQVLNDQCMKCGIVVSKFHKPEAPSPTAPVSFVAAPATGRKQAEYSIPASVFRTDELRKKAKLKQAITTAVIVAVVLAGGWTAYRMFLRHAAQYSGQYKNGSMLFALKFPEKGSRWYHYREGELSSPLYRDAGDAFYLGGSPDNPEVTLGVWNEGISALPERFTAEQAESLLKDEENALSQALTGRGVDFTITSSEQIKPGGNDGFRWLADVKVKETPMKLIVIRAYYMNAAYWVFASGTADAMSRNEDEMNRILESLNFKISVI